jgi:hypothetical protein
MIILSSSKQRATNCVNAVRPFVISNETLHYHIDTVQPDETQDRYHNQAQEVINRFERQAEEYGDQRLVQVPEEDIQTLRSALEPHQG